MWVSWKLWIYSILTLTTSHQAFDTRIWYYYSTELSPHWEMTKRGQKPLCATTLALEQVCYLQPDSQRPGSWMECLWPTWILNTSMERLRLMLNSVFGTNWGPTRWGLVVGLVTHSVVQFVHTWPRADLQHHWFWTLHEDVLFTIKYRHKWFIFVNEFKWCLSSSAHNHDSPTHWTLKIHHEWPYWCSSWHQLKHEHHC